MFKVLFLCTGNSARSQMAEALLNKAGKGKFLALSAGSNPGGSVNEYALEVMEQNGFDVSALRTKNMMEFIDEDIDFVITVCDKMKEECPVFPAKPIYAHWGMPDPVDFEGTEAEKKDFFKKTFLELSNRINLFLCIEMDKLDRDKIENELGEIAKVWKYVR